MKICVFAICRNEAALIPFWIRHYTEIADAITVFDDHSDDGSRALLSEHPSIKVKDWPGNNGIDEDAFLQFAYQTYPSARGQFRWVLWVDMDEFLYHPHLKEFLRDNQQYDVIRTTGYNMIGDGLPSYEGRQIWEVLKHGVQSSVYSKPVIFNPAATVRWNRGKHDLEACAPRLLNDSPVMLLHYRYLGEAYTRLRNRRNYQRCGFKTGDKAAAWTCAPHWQGAHSPEWAKSIQPNAVQIIP